MNVFDKIDAATFKVIDNAVLWLWNEWGVPYRSLATLTVMVSDMVFLAYMSEWGADYDVLFWVIASVVLTIDTLLILGLQIVPPDVINAIRLRNRTSTLARLIRLTWLTLAVVSVLGGRLPAVGVNVLMLAQHLIIVALIPTGPRKRREARSTNLAWSPT